MEITQDKRKQLLVVFDIDETLIQYISKGQLPNTMWESVPKKVKDMYKFSIVEDGQDKIFLRPGLHELFRWFNLNKDSVRVALWTYSEQQYSQSIANMLTDAFGLDSDFFLFTWGCEQIEEEFEDEPGDDYPKNLRKVWSDFTNFNTFNTIIVDDLHGNIRHTRNVNNCILIQPYAPFSRNKIREPLPDPDTEKERMDMIINDNAMDILKNICEKVMNDLKGCDSEEDIDPNFDKEGVFSPTRVKRMGLKGMMRKYAFSKETINFVTLPAIGESYQTNKFVDISVPELARTHNVQKKGGKKSSLSTRNKRKRKTSKRKKTRKSKIATRRISRKTKKRRR